MNTHTTSRGNKAHNDKDSILADTKNLLKILYPAIQGMPKIHRIEGAPVEMKIAAHKIIRHFYIAKDCQELRNAISPEWWQWVEWDERRLCVVSKPKFTLRDRLKKKYKLKIKNNERIRNHRIA